MEPISIVVGMYIANNFLDQFIAQEGYSFLRKLFFRKISYADKLYQIFESTALEYEKKYPADTTDGKIPFYHSAPLFELLNQEIVFSATPSLEELTSNFENLPNVIPPTQDELKCFYDTLIENINACEALKTLHIEENYKENHYCPVKDEEVGLITQLFCYNEFTTNHCKTRRKPSHGAL
jgi:hypothetical protein